MMSHRFITLLCCVLGTLSQGFVAVGRAEAQSPRGRDLGIPFEGDPGPLNAITDVGGVEVGHTTLIHGDPPLRIGVGPVRTGVTAILPRGRRFGPVYAGWHALNGAGEMTGTTWLEASGFLEGPIMITTTHSVGVVRDAVLRWMRDDRVHAPGDSIFLILPVVAETYDGFLNDVSGFHITQEHAIQALRTASGGPVVEGSVGGGTGMMCHEFKGGVGTSSRAVGPYTVGVLVQCNYGRRTDLVIAGVPVGRELTGGRPTYGSGSRGAFDDPGSIIVVVATDAPLLPHQLRRLAQRPSLGLGRMGSVASNGSGDIFIAFSTANEQAWTNRAATVETLPNTALSPFFLATVQATEEAIVNALVAGREMDGAGGRLFGIPHDELREVLRRFGRLR